MKKLSFDLLHMISAGIHAKALIRLHDYRRALVINQSRDLPNRSWVKDDGQSSHTSLHRFIQGPRCSQLTHLN